MSGGDDIHEAENDMTEFPPEIGLILYPGVQMAAVLGMTDLLIHVRHEFPGTDAPFFTPGTDAVEIIPTVGPAGAEPVIVKNHPNSFRDTALHESLRGAGVEEVVVIGAMSHMCIAATSRAATDLGYRTIVVHDACATMDLEFDGQTVPAAQVHAANMAAIAFAHGEVVTTEGLLAR